LGSGEYSQREEDKEASKTENEEYHPEAAITGKPFTQSSHNQQLEQAHPFEEDDGHLDNELKAQNFNDIDESGDPEKTFEKSNQLTATTAADKIENVAEVSSTYTHDNNKDVLPFEFSMFYRDLQKYMAASYKRLGNNGKVWFSGKIDKRIGVVTAANLGRLAQQQQGEL